MEEDEIVTGLVQRDFSALNALMNAFINPVYSLCKRILHGIGTAEDVEECTSDSFYAAWNSAGKYDPNRASLRTWVLVITKYTALDRRRSLMRKANLHDLPLNDEIISSKAQETLSTIKEREQLQALLKTLPPLDRKLIYERYFLDESVTNLALRHGLSRQALENRLWRARKSLKLLLGREETKEAESDD